MNGKTTLRFLSEAEARAPFSFEKTIELGCTRLGLDFGGLERTRPQCFCLFVQYDLCGTDDAGS